MEYFLLRYFIYSLVLLNTIRFVLRFDFLVTPKTHNFDFLQQNLKLDIWFKRTMNTIF